MTLRVAPLPRAWSGVVRPWTDTDPSVDPSPPSGAPPLAHWRERIEGAARECLLVAGPPDRVRTQVERMAAGSAGSVTVLDESEVIDAVIRAGRIATPGERHLAWGGGSPPRLRELPPEAAGEGDCLIDLLRGRLWIQADALIPADTLPVWGVDPPAGGAPGTWRTGPAGSASLLQGVKTALDPEGRLVCGRLPGGI
jgi:hypothetical protein